MKNRDATRNIPSWTMFDFFLWCSMKKLVWVHAEGRSWCWWRSSEVGRLKWNFVCNIQITHRKKRVEYSLGFIPCSFEALSESYLDLTCVIFLFSNFNSCRLFTRERAVSPPLINNPFINFSTSLFFLLLLIFLSFFSTWLELFNYYYFSNFFLWFHIFPSSLGKYDFLHEFHEQINSKTPLSSLVLLGALLNFLFFELFNIFFSSAAFIACTSLSTHKKI